MLEQIDFAAPSLAKEVYKPLYDELVERLVVLQQQARLSQKGVVVVFEGWKGAGKGSRMSDLLYNLDARSTMVAVTDDLDRDKAERYDKLKSGVSGPYPAMQEFWKALGPRGSMTFFVQGWYMKTVQSLLFAQYGSSFGCGRNTLKKKNVKELETLLAHTLSSLEEFERQLTHEGYLVVKFFLHISEEEQKRRLRELRDDPATKWRVSKKKLRCAENYQQSLDLYENLLEQSDFDYAPWIILNGEDKRRANLDIAAALVGALESAMSPISSDSTPPNDAKELSRQDTTAASSSASPASSADIPASPADTPASSTDIPVSSSVVPAKAGTYKVTQPQKWPLSTPLPSLGEVSRDLRLEREEYKEQLEREQQRFFELELAMYRKRIPLMILFEGWDAAGKGGAIKRVAQALDARAYTIFPSPAPTAEEKAHPHLWRYWTRLPKAGHVGIYDRSWYGRVLVERVEGFATKDEWSRAYGEINGFEHDLVDWGALLIKFWVEVSQEEQLGRFKEREADPSKRWKITEDDWRNRAKYPEYRAAVEDMFALTSTAGAPWTILEGEDKYYARVRALRVINNALEKRLG